MNGVHCHTRAATTAASGIDDIQSGWTTSSMPKSEPNQLSAPLNRPYSGLYSACFHSSAAETGTSRNGVMSRVRTMPRPKKRRLRSRAKPRPSATLTRTTEAVRITVVITASRRAASVKTEA